MEAEDGQQDIPEKVQGKIREAVGDATDDDRLTSEGLEQQIQAENHDNDERGKNGRYEDDEHARAQREADQLLDDSMPHPKN